MRNWSCAVIRAERQRLVRHDEGGLVAYEHDDMPALLDQRPRHPPQAVVIGRLAPGAGRAGIDLAEDEAVRRMDRQDEARPVRAPFVRQLAVRHPQAEELLALGRRGNVDRAALARRAMPAPGARRLFQLRQRVDLAAQGAAAAGASGRGGIGRDDHGRGHVGVFFLVGNRPDRYRGAAALARRTAV